MGTLKVFWRACGVVLLNWYVILIARLLLAGLNMAVALKRHTKSTLLRPFEEVVSVPSQLDSVVGSELLIVFTQQIKPPRTCAKSVCCPCYTVTPFRCDFCRSLAQTLLTSEWSECSSCWFLSIY